MKKGILLVIWGIVLLSIHINLGPIPILPPFIGMILIVVGISAMSREFHSKSLTAAKAIAIFLTVYSLLSTIDEFLGLTSALFTSQIWFYRYTMALNSVILILQALCFFFLLISGVEFLEQKGLQSSAHTLRINQWIYLALMAGAALFSAFCINLPVGFDIYMVIFAIAVRLYYIILLCVLRSNAKLALLPQPQAMEETSAPTEPEPPAQP